MFATFPPSAAGLAPAGTAQFYEVVLTDATVFDIVPGIYSNYAGDYSDTAMLTLEIPAWAELVRITSRLTFDHPQLSGLANQYPVLRISRTTRANLDFEDASQGLASTPSVMLWVHDGAGAVLGLDASHPIDARHDYLVPLDSITEEVKSFRDSAGDTRLVGGVNRFPRYSVAVPFAQLDKATPVAGDVLYDGFVGAAGTAYVRVSHLLRGRVDGATTLRARITDYAGTVLASCEFDFTARSSTSPIATRRDSNWLALEAAPESGSVPMLTVASSLLLTVDVVSTTATRISGQCAYTTLAGSAAFDV